LGFRRTWHRTILNESWAIPGKRRPDRRALPCKTSSRPAVTRRMMRIHPPASHVRRICTLRLSTGCEYWVPAQTRSWYPRGLPSRNKMVLSLLEPPSLSRCPPRERIGIHRGGNSPLAGYFGVTALLAVGQSVSAELPNPNNQSRARFFFPRFRRHLRPVPRISSPSRGVRGWRPCH
jgi:hypothetical protein